MNMASFTKLSQVFLWSALFLGFLGLLRNVNYQWNPSQQYKEIRSEQFNDLDVETLHAYKTGSPDDGVSADFALHPEDMIYGVPYNTSIRGQPFEIDTQVLSRLGLPQSKFVTLEGDFLDEFVFVTASSSNHFEESRMMMDSVRRYYPGRRLLFYDIGLTEEQRKQFTDEKTQWYHAELRSFNFSSYPEHVSNLTTYAFKFLVIQKVLREFPAVFWMDTSVRLRSTLMERYRQFLVENNGIAIFTYTLTRPFQVTHPDMYRYFPTDVERLQEPYVCQATVFLVYNTEVMYRNLLHWAYLCSLTRSCIAPTERQNCWFNGKSVWAQCHRFDQSMLNLLLCNWASFDYLRYYPESGWQMVYLDRT